VGGGLVERVGELRIDGGAAGVEVSRRTLHLVALAAAFAAVYVIWGSTYLAIAIGLESIPPLMLMGVRSVTAGALLYGIARARGAPRADAAAWRNALLVGVLFFVIGHGLLSWGETRVASGAAAVLLATEPLFIVALAWIGGGMIRRSTRERPGNAVIASLVLGIAGVALMTLPGSGGIDPLGAIALVIASLSWAIGTFHVEAHGSPVRAAGMQLFAGGTILLLLSALTGEVASFDAAAVNGRSVYALLYLIVFGSLITYAAYIWLLQQIGAARVASHTFVNPVIAVALGAWLGDEAFGARTIAASLLVLIAVVLLVRGRASDAERRESVKRSLRPLRADGGATTLAVDLRR
jgi:drug/metabolite transporter (DMT)-like permease